MIAAARELLGARDLLWQWTGRTLQARYQQSLLGWLWAFVQPATQAAVFAVIFTYLVPVETGGTPYPVFAYVATTAWAFLAASLTDMTNSLVDNMNLVTKIYFPREVLPVAYMLARLADFAIAAVLFVVIALYYQVPFYPAGLLVLPVVLLVQTVLVVGLGLAAAGMNVFVRDVRSVLVLVMQVWFYASPVIYPIDAVPAHYRALYALNPMVGIIESYRDVLLRARMPDTYLLSAALVATVVFVLGYWFFQRVESRFADIV